MLRLTHESHHKNLVHQKSSTSNTMPVASSSPSCTSSPSPGLQGGSNSSTGDDLLNSSNSSSGSSGRFTRHLEQPTSSVPRVRTIRLRRPPCFGNLLQRPSQQLQLENRNLLNGNANSMGFADLMANESNSSQFGFSIRGGSEHRTGFFVSHVETGSEADYHGLLVGDQVIRVNNHPVDDATHKEMSQYIANQSHLTLRVRNMGMIPVKDRDTDPLTWQMIQQDQRSPSSSDYGDMVQCQTVLVTLSLGPKEKLGLGICKGPEWKPGIFVQFTKEHGIAHRAGLKPGDQILRCNDVEFLDIIFSDAVAVMKSSSVLELIVRTAVGLELFPGESSGYNSSASSVTGGDQSPCWNESSGARRYDVEGRMNTTNFNSPFRPKVSSGHRDRLMAVNTPKVPQLQSAQKVQPKPARNGGGLGAFRPPTEEHNSDHNTTIIKLSEAGTMINNTMISHVPQPPAIATSTFRSNVMANGSDYCGCSENMVTGQECEHRTVVAEVHGGPQQVRKMNAIPPPPPPPMQMNGNKLSAPVVPSIADEIKQRAQNLRAPNVSIEDQLKLKAKVNGVCAHQHNQLMDEFKKAHQKMFKNGVQKAEDNEERHSLGTDDVDYAFRDNTSTSAIRVDNSKTVDNQRILVNGKSSANRQLRPSTTNNIPDCSEISPPPPIEFADNVPTNKRTQILPQPWSAADNRNNLAAGGVANGINMRSGGKPVSPTPDYDSMISIPAENSSSSLQSGIAARSMAFQKSKSTAPKAPTPPKPARSISVTIGEYDAKREPAKLGFLPNDSANKFEGSNGNISQSDSLQNELQMTLSRSNLRKSSESTEFRNGGRSTTTVLNTKTQLAPKSNLNERNAAAGPVHANGNGNKVTIAIVKADSGNEAVSNSLSKVANGKAHMVAP